MANITIYDDTKTPSIVDLGEEPVTKKVTLIMGDRTKRALINLVNERRKLLRERVAENVPVVGSVENVEEALLDAIGGIGAAGGAKWFRNNF